MLCIILNSEFYGCPALAHLRLGILEARLEQYLDYLVHALLDDTRNYEYSSVFKVSAMSTSATILAAMMS